MEDYKPFVHNMLSVIEGYLFPSSFRSKVVNIAISANHWEDMEV